MNKRGSFDFKAFVHLRDRFKQALDEKAVEGFIREFLLDMALLALARIKLRTPVDTGLLRNNWYIGEIRQKGNNYEIEIYNNIEYASYVEYGHRNKGSGWTDGFFMATISLKELEKQFPKYLQQRQHNLLSRIMHGGGKDDKQ